MQPALIPALVLPLLYSAALDASLLEIRANLRPVVSLSAALVLLPHWSLARPWPQLLAVGQ